MNKEQKISALLAVLFSSGEPMSIERLSSVFEEKPEKIEETAKLLEERLKEQKMGIMLLRLQNTYQLASDEQYAEYIKIGIILLVLLAVAYFGVKYYLKKRKSA